MKNFNDPTQFNAITIFDDIEVQYSDLMELNQGGPEIGILQINSKKIFPYRFGGPCLYCKGFVFAPVYVRKILKSGFKLARINVQTLEVDILGKIKDLIFLEKIENNKIYYFQDINKTISGYYNF